MSFLETAFCDSGSSSDGLGALNMICPPSDCQVGQGQIAQAVDWWNHQASATTKQTYGAALQVITDRRQAILDRYAAGSTLPTSECCELADIGRQAAQLTAQMATADKLAPPPNIEASSAWDTLLKAAGIVAAAGVAASLIGVGASLASTAQVHNSAPPQVIRRGRGRGRRRSYRSLSDKRGG